MSECGEVLPSNPIDQLSRYIAAEQERMAAVDGFLSEALPQVENVGACNARLVEAGRPDLVISSSAILMEVSSPLEVIERCNNFISGFQIYTGHAEITVERPHGLPPREETVPIPITEKELDSLIIGAPTFEPSVTNNTCMPAYERMLVLFPDFTKRLTLDFSETGYAYLYERYRPELFAAYQLMSRLVDQEDEYVMQDGRVNKEYLLR